MTQACEWKSNLFVPKSNDILFAQSASAGHHQPLAGPEQQQAAGGQPVEALGAHDALAASRNAPADQYQEQAANSRTILSTSSKALVLALPIALSQTFAGYEPGE